MSIARYSTNNNRPLFTFAQVRNKPWPCSTRKNAERKKEVFSAGFSGEVAVVAVVVVEGLHRRRRRRRRRRREQQQQQQRKPRTMPGQKHRQRRRHGVRRKSRPRQRGRGHGKLTFIWSTVYHFFQPASRCFRPASRARRTETYTDLYPAKSKQQCFTTAKLSWKGDS